MTSNDPLISDLFMRRNGLAVDLAKAQAIVARIESEIGAVDTVLRLFGAGSPLHISVLPLHRRDTSKIIWTSLTASTRPLTSTELARMVIVERKFDAHDEDLVRAVAKRVRASLNHLRRRGAVRAEENQDGLLTWSRIEISNTSRHTDRNG